MLNDLLHRSYTKIACYTLLLAGMYYSAFTRLVTYDWSREDYSYGYLIPFVVLYLLWENRQQMVSTPSAPAWKGLIPCGLGIALFWLGELGGEFFTMYISFWLVIVGLCWLHLGWQKLKAMGFALVMILAMFPPPGFLDTRISVYLKLISSQVGVWMLHVCGMSAYREGNVIDLGFTQLQVVDACSGLRYLFPLMVLSLVLAYWFKAHFWKRVVLFLSSVPLAILVNSARIAITGVLYGIFGAKVAEGFFHGFSSWLIFIAAIPFLLVEMWVLKWLPPKGPIKGLMDDRCAGTTADARTRDAGETEERGTTAPLGRWTKWLHQLFQPVFIVAIVLLGSTLVLSKGIEFREKVPISKPFSQFPINVGEWSGSRQNMAQEFLDTLTFSDYVIVDYRNARGKVINFYVAYYDSQRKGESIHTPDTCLPMTGWIFREAGATTIPISNVNPGSIKVNRAFMEKAGQRELAYYWFPMRGRILTSLYQLKIYNFWDALTKQRTDGALVRIITPVYPNESLQDAEVRLQEFTALIVPVLKEYIPE